MLYNFGKPRVHRDSSNVVLVDGHVDSMTFEDFVSPDFDLWRN
jgi:prepilin-type processing-associated H-X9-DG protein